MKKYTEKVHAQRLLKMLNKKDICGCCPASIRYNGNSPVAALWSASLYKEICRMCNDFIDMESWGAFFPPANKRCPCRKLGGKEAVKRTWLALEEKGYI